MPDPYPHGALVSEADLAVTWRTLMACAHNWKWESAECATLIEAQRLVGHEVLQQHGDEALERVTNQDVDFTPRQP